jgi:hypothetical protein
MVSYERRNMRRNIYMMENLFNPKWWDKWLKKNLKKKARLFSKRVK